MASDRLAAGVRSLVIAGAGVVAATSATNGLYATTVLATLVALWTGATAVIAARPIVLPPPPPPPSSLQGEDRLRLLAYLDLSPAPLVVYEDGNLFAVNRAARRLFATDAMIPAPPSALMEAMTTTRTGRTATVTIDDGGAPRAFALAAGELLLAGSVARVGALIDIGAELKAAEATALRELVQVLSHEIVNTLTPIASLAETAAAMLDDDPVDAEGVREAVTTVARRAGGLQRFGEAYRTLARLPAPERRSVALGDLVADLARLFAVRWPDMPLAVDTARAPATLVADPDQLSAALWALLQNAAEAAEGRADGQVALTVAAAIDAVSVTVSNTGTAIPPAIAETIFQPFMTTKAAGSGVGLALARQIVRGHGGDVTLLGSDAEATRFHVALPQPGA